MDLRAYYQKVREAEAAIAEPYPVVESFETGDGGKPGVRTEVTRSLAAKMVVDGTARLLPASDAAAHRKAQVDAKTAIDAAAAAKMVQFTVVPMPVTETKRPAGTQEKK